MYEPEKSIKCKLNKIELECTKQSLRTVNEDIETHYQTYSSFNIFNPNFPVGPSFPAIPQFPGFFGNNNPGFQVKPKSKSKSKSKNK